MHNVDPGLFVVIAGAFVTVAGLVIMAVVPWEGARLRGILIPILEMEFPDFGMGQLVPMLQGLIRLVLERIFLYIRIIGLLGGLATVIAGVVIILGGFTVY